MPNWCENVITIEGPKSVIGGLWDRVIDADKNTDRGLLQALRPMPKELEDTTAPSIDGLMTWYDWRLMYWGVKWDVETNALDYMESPNGEHATIDGFFESPWGPPIEALEWFAEQNPAVSIELGYLEPGIGFAGVFSTRGGEESKDETVSLDAFNDIDDVPHSLRNAIPMLEIYFEMLELAEEES